MDTPLTVCNYYIDSARNLLDVQLTIGQITDTVVTSLPILS